MNELKEFTEEIRDFLNEKLTPELRHFGESYTGYHCPLPVAKEWVRILDDKGWAVPAWPVEYGGRGWSAEKLVTFNREMMLGHAPRLMTQGIHMVGPVIAEYGTEEQKAEFLPRIRRGDDWWAQGYSEPGSGSDLASLKTRAVSDGDDYIINGSKIWTTNAHVCNKIFCLVRTSDEGKKQAGISFLVFDIDLPGIEIRPIHTFAGEHEFNQVFFSDVRVPKSALMGNENDGWNVSKFLLVGERGVSYAMFSHDYLARIRSFASRQTTANGLLIDDPAFRMKLASIEIELASLDAIEAKTLEMMKKDWAGATELAAVSKIHGTQLQQRVSELGVEVMGYYAIPLQPEIHEPSSMHELIGEPTPNTAVSVAQYFGDRCLTIAGGTTEVQKNIIATRVLGF